MKVEKIVTKTKRQKRIVGCVLPLLVALLSFDCGATETGFEPKAQVNNEMPTVEVNNVPHYGDFVISRGNASDSGDTAIQLSFQAFTAMGEFDEGGFAPQGINVVSGVLRLSDAIVVAALDGVRVEEQLSEERNNTNWLSRINDGVVEELTPHQFSLELGNEGIDGTITGVLTGRAELNAQEVTPITDGPQLDFRIAGDRIEVLCLVGSDSLEISTEVSLACTRWGEVVDCTEPGTPDLRCPTSN